GVRPAVRLSASHHDVGALLSTPVTFAEQRAGRAGPRRIAQVYSQPPASGRFRLPVAPRHSTSLPVTSRKCIPGSRPLSAHLAYLVTWAGEACSTAAPRRSGSAGEAVTPSRVGPEGMIGA